MNKCIAIASGDRIQLIIRKGDSGYKAFANVLNKIEKGECFSWYGDVTDENDKERCGLVVTCQPKGTKWWLAKRRTTTPCVNGDTAST